MIKLTDWGFPQEYLPKDNAPAQPARVTAVWKERFQLITPQGEQLAQLKTKEFYYEPGRIFPTTGDFVLALPAPGDWQIVETLPRRSFFSRLDGWHGTEQAVAANMDVVFAVQSLNQDFSPQRLERYLTLAWNSKAKPIVLLTKRDLPGNHEEKLVAARETAGPQVPVIALSARTGEGMEELAPYLRPGETAALLGSSGVGKSSLINRLAGEDIMTVSGIRERDGRGRHTTTHRQLLRLASGLLVIDTPGMRELGMWDAAEGLSAAFPDVEQYFASCRFRDCRHENEPGCAVRAALESGELDSERWKSYQVLNGESQRTHHISTVRMKQGQPSRSLAKSRRQEKKYRKNFSE